MEDLTPQQIKKLERLAKLIDDGEIGVAEELTKLEEDVDSAVEMASDALVIASETSKIEVQGIQGEKGEKGDKGDDGRDGINPLYVGENAPVNPKIGNLWYKP